MLFDLVEKNKIPNMKFLTQLLKDEGMPRPGIFLFVVERKTCTMLKI
jgi:hypothetical protein